NETTQAFTFRPNLSQRSPTCRARFRRLRPLSSETNALVVHAQSQLTLSIFDRDGVAPDQHPRDQRRCWPLLFSTIRGNADGDAKAMCGEWRQGLRGEPPLLPDLAAGRSRPRRTVLAPQATRPCLLPQMHFANSARPAKR